MVTLKPDTLSFISASRQNGETVDDTVRRLIGLEGRPVSRLRGSAKLGRAWGPVAAQLIALGVGQTLVLPWLYSDQGAFLVGQRPYADALRRVLLAHRGRDYSERPSHFGPGGGWTVTRTA